MFGKIITFLVIVFAAVLQISLFPNIFPSGLAPELVLLVVIFWVAHDGYDKTWAKAILAGFVLDIFYFWPIGTNIIAISIAAFGISYLTKRFAVSYKNLGFFVMLTIVLAGTLANDLVLNFLTMAYNHFETIKIQYFVSNIWNDRIILRIITNLGLFTLIYWPLLTLGKFLSFYDKKSMQGRFFR
jgi:rod shape-determining protein MreD